MRMSLEELVSRTRAAVREFSQSVDVMQVVASDGEADHVELLLTVSGCHKEPCTVLVNLPREGDEFEASLRSRLHEALAQHAPDRTVRT